MGQTSIAVRNETLQQFNRCKAEYNAAQANPDHNADSFVRALLEAWDAADETDGGDGERFTDAQRGEAREIALDVVNSRVVREALE